MHFSHPESNPSGRRKRNHARRKSCLTTWMLHCLSWVRSTAPSCWAKKSCHQNELFLSSSVLLSREWFLIYKKSKKKLCSLIIQNIERHWSWHQYLPKHTLLGEAFGWQMPPRGQRRRITRKARSLPATNNLERLLCKLLDRMYVYIHIYIYTYICMYRTPWMGLSWRPFSAARLFGNVELLGYLTCQIHVHWALQVACG